MIAYKVYLCDDKMNASELIGVLPERRTDLKRIDIESVVKWSEAVFGETTVNRFFSYRRLLYKKNLVVFWCGE
jgi:hypothetical protein